MGKMIKIMHDDSVLRAFMLFMQVAQAAYKHADRRFYYGTDATTATFVALKGLVHNGGVMTHTQLADWTNTEKHNITSLVDRMKKDGLVTSAYSDEDRRVSNIQVTEKGREVFEQATPVAREIVERIMRGIGRGDATGLEKPLKVMKKNLERESADQMAQR